MPLSKIHNTLTSDHILLDGTDSTGANANSNVILDSSAASTDVGALMSYEAGAVDGAVTLPVGRDDLSLTGSIVQVKQGLFSGFVTLTNSGTSAVFADIFLEVDITPTSASNNILLLAQLAVSSGTADRLAFVKFVGGNTADHLSGRAIGSRTPCHQAVYFAGANEMLAVSMNFLDSPATTDSVKYKVQVAPSFTSGNVFVNKVNFDSDNAYIPSASTVITAIEVAA
tara:strand:+ start:241 stop:921 length:681 start_codon:yes stop_codon:yes gene_type:complete